MKKFLVSLLVVLAGAQAHALPVSVKQRDLRLATQQMVEKQTFTNPAAASANDLLNDNDGPSSAAVTTVTSFSAQPDVPRTINIAPGDVYGDIESCHVTVTGTNFFGDTITEEYAFVANQTTGMNGNQAFKTVTSISWAASCESGGFAASWSVGYGEKLGLKRCVDSAGHFLFSTLNGAKEGTAPTLTVGNTVGVNTADFNGSMQGSNDFELFFFQNYRCF